MRQRCVVIGAGIIGAAIAAEMAQAGHHVTIVEAAGVASAASGSSFGWINASFYADEAHFHLRAEGLAAWQSLGMPDITWQGCLWFEETGTGFDAMRRALGRLNYPVEVIEKSTFHALEPAMCAPDHPALRFASEGAAETGRVTQALIARAKEAGALLLTGVACTGVEAERGAVTGVATSAGTLPADIVIAAAGSGTGAIIAPFGAPLPMQHRPGLLMMTRPLPPVLAHVIAAPGQELRQLPDGRLLAPTSPNHQADTATEISEPALRLGAEALERVRALLPGQEIEMEEISLALRPVPEDGLPCIGPAGPDGLYVATMHSGVTLAAIVARLVTQELTNGGPAALLAPYRPARFLSP